MSCDEDMASSLRSWARVIANLVPITLSYVVLLALFPVCFIMANVASKPAIIFFFRNVQAYIKMLLARLSTLS